MGYAEDDSRPCAPHPLGGSSGDHSWQVICGRARQLATRAWLGMCARTAEEERIAFRRVRSVVGLVPCFFGGLVRWMDGCRKAASIVVPLGHEGLIEEGGLV